MAQLFYGIAWLITACDMQSSAWDSSNYGHIFSAVDSTSDLNQQDLFMPCCTSKYLYVTRRSCPTTGCMA